MYEVWIWKTAYDVVNFPFPWSVANFIESGNRLRQPTSMPEEIYSIIDNCWKHKMNDRIDMFEVVYQLEHLPEDVKIYTHKPNNKINEDNIEE
ncbi:Protein serine/threonine kinase [Entamoeba marina]